MEKIWYLLINEVEEGPFSVDDLKEDMRISPETLVWREGFDAWLMAGYVEELKVLFKDEVLIDSPFIKKEIEGNEVIAENLGPDLFFRWLPLFLILFLFFYLVYRFYG